MYIKGTLLAKMASVMVTVCLMMALAPAMAVGSQKEIVVADGIYTNSELSGVQPSIKTVGDVAPLEDGIISSGVWGSCQWEIDQDGVLTIHPGVGESTNEESLAAWHDNANKVTKVVCVKEDGKKVVAPTSCKMLFSDLAAVMMDLSGLDTSSVTDMSLIFSQCASLTYLNISGWNTSNVAMMRGMFYECSLIADLNISGLSTSSATDMSCMFCNCSSLSSLNLGSWDTSSVANVGKMFYGCGALTTLNLFGWDTSAVTAADSMLYGCTSLESFKVGNRYEIKGADMFPNATGPSERWWSVADDTWYTKLDVVTNRSCVADTYRFMYPNGTIASGDWGSCAWDIDENGMLVICPGEGTNTGAENPAPWYGWRDKVLSVTCVDKEGSKVVAPSMCESLFRELTATWMDLSGLDTSNVTSMSQMIYGCQSLCLLDLSGWDTSKVTSMGSMFNGCSSLETLDLSGWDTSSVKDMRGMFYGCVSIASIDVGESYAIKGVDMLPAATANNGRWWSAAVGAWCTREQIQEYRSCVADTYKSEGPETVNIANATLYAAKQTYTGGALEPALVVTMGGFPLELGIDYTVSYENNVNVGSAIATVIGLGPYTGAKSTKFTISPAAITTITVKTKTYTYNGMAKMPGVTVIAGNIAVPKSGYTIIYKNNVNVGNATITVKGRGNFSGSKSSKFTIGKAENPMTVKGKTVNLSVAKLKKNQSVSASKAVTVNAAQGAVTYKLISVAESKYKGYFAIASNGKITVAKGLRKGAYKLTVEVRAAGDANYKKSTKRVAITVKVV